MNSARGTLKDAAGAAFVMVTACALPPRLSASERSDFPPPPPDICDYVSPSRRDVPARGTRRVRAERHDPHSNHCTDLRTVVARYLFGLLLCCRLLRIIFRIVFRVDTTVLITEDRKLAFAVSP